MATKEEEDLVLLFLDEPDLVCESLEPDHNCTVTAKFVAQVEPRCTLPGIPLTKLWCQSRYELHVVDTGSWVRCRCGQMVAHWKVRAL